MVSSAGIVAKFSTIAGGAWIEQTETPFGTTRVWRFDDKGRAEWACLDMISDGRERWFGHQFTEADFTLC
jgi:hypothetical protein